MACGSPNEIGIISTVDPDPFLIERDPHHADWIVGTGWKQVEIAAPFTVLEHFLVPAKRRHFRDPAYFPLADGRRSMSGTDCDWICSDKLIAFANFKHIGFAVDFHCNGRCSRFSSARLFVFATCVSILLLRLIFHVICWLRSNIATRFYVFH